MCLIYSLFKRDETSIYIDLPTTSSYSPVVSTKMEAVTSEQLFLSLRILSYPHNGIQIKEGFPKAHWGIANNALNEELKYSFTFTVCPHSISSGVGSSFSPRSI